MSLPTTDVIFASVRAADSWIEYPLMSVGDKTAKIYHMRCSVNLDDYTPLDLDDLMTNATTAGVITLPFTGNSSAYFVGDFNHNYIDGKLVEFDRQFATVPADRTRLKGSRIFQFPGYDTVETDPRLAFSKASNFRIQYEYDLGGDSFTIPDIFQPTRTNGDSTVYNVAYVSDTVTTSPTRTVYETYTAAAFTADLAWIVADVQIREWKGNIYVMEIHEVRAI